MAASEPGRAISLHGADGGTDEPNTGSSSGILLKLSDEVLKDLRKAAQTSGILSLITGNAPKIRIGDTSIDLSVSPDAFRTELYASTTASSAIDLTFAGLVSHRAELRPRHLKSDQETSGTDAALAALQNSLASYEQEKQAKQTNITNSILPTPKNRFDAARRERLDKKRPGSGMNGSSQPGSPAISATGTPRLGPGPTSVPASEKEVKTQAMRTAVIHFLAMKSQTGDEIAKRTHIPKEELDEVLHKVGKHVEGKWRMTDRTYKELDVWKFGYPSQEQRQIAIDNAIRAYDRLRLGREEILWQMLLPKKDRNKGIHLSKLDMNAGGHVNKALTPHYQPSPTPHVDGTMDSKPASTANTPRLGASTPRTGASKGNVMKRLLSKDPKKARAAEDAKEKKRKEREAAASDKEGEKPAKKQATKKLNVKSEEIVHSSDDESEDGEVTKSEKAESTTAQSNGNKATKLKAKAAVLSSDSSDAPLKQVTKAKPTATASKSTTSPAAKARKPDAAGKSTPKTAAFNGLSAPSSQQKSQKSPQKAHSRPNVPSPLGAARPRVASDVSDKAAVGVQKLKPGAGTPKGLGITSATRPRQDTVTSTESFESELTMQNSNSSDRPAIKTMSKPADSVNHRAEASPAKRKAENSPAHVKETNKHRKTDSSSSQPQKMHSSSDTAQNDSAIFSPNGLIDSSSDSSGSVIDSITYNQGVALAEKFRDTYYPAYAKLYDTQAAMGVRGEKVSKDERERLLAMHKRLEQMKREIVIASQRQE